MIMGSYKARVHATVEFMVFAFNKLVLKLESLVALAYIICIIFNSSRTLIAILRECSNRVYVNWHLNNDWDAYLNGVFALLTVCFLTWVSHIYESINYPIDISAAINSLKTCNVIDGMRYKKMEIISILYANAQNMQCHWWDEIQEIGNNLNSLCERETWIKNTIMEQT